MIVPVGVSKRHAHISREVALILFGSDKLPIRNNLKQPGQYASERTLNLKWDNNIIPFFGVHFAIYSIRKTYFIYY